MAEAPTLVERLLDWMGNSEPEDRAFLAEVETLTRERDEAQAANAVCRRDIEALMSSCDKLERERDEAIAERDDLRKQGFPDTLTPELAEVLGMPNFRAGPFAYVFRDAGEADISRKSEAEQAFVLHWLTTLVLKHGKDWKLVAGKKLEELSETIRARSLTREVAGT